MEFRIAKPEEVEQIIDLANYVFRTSNNLEPSMGRQFPLFLSPENASNLYVAVDNGKVVSHIGINKNTAIIHGHRLSMAGMGSVCTHPDYRGQGLATKLLQKVFDSLKQQGVAILKISGNRGLYKTNGCMEIESITSYTFDKETYSRDTEFSTKTAYKYEYLDNPQDASVLADIYHREPVRYERAKWEFPILFHAMPTVHPPAGRIYTAVVARYDSSLNHGIAYIIGYEKDSGIYDIVEYAGERAAIPGMIQYLIREKNMKEVGIHYPSYDAAMTELLTSISPDGGKIHLSPMTVKITNREVLWSQISSIIAERWPDRNFPKSLKDLEEVCKLQNQDIMRFLFGDYERPSWGKPWDGVLPIELPWFIGLNYV